MDLLKYFANCENLQFMIIGHIDDSQIIWLLENILIKNSRLFYINQFIEDNYINLIKLNNFLESTKNYSDKIIFIKNNPVTSLKNPFITTQQYNYIQVTCDNINDSSTLIELIILSFNLLRSGGIIHVHKYNINLIFVLDFFKSCYVNKYNIIHENIQNLILQKI